MTEPLSTFNINFIREIFLLGEDQYVSMLKKVLKTFNFLVPRSGRDYSSTREETHFLVAAVDFRAPAQVQAYVRLFSELSSALAHKIAFVIDPDTVTREQMLLFSEIGVRFTAFGLRRTDDLKDYIKRVCVEAQQVGSLDREAIELEQARKKPDVYALRRIADRLKNIPVQTEEVHRMIAVAAVAGGDLKRAEIHLKKLLHVNPQNLWAANTLGRMYIKSGRVGEGVEVLERLSKYHELNGERLLAVGDAYVKAGMAREAEAKYVAGQALAEGVDPRFKEGMAKVKLVDKDYAGALSLMHGKKFSSEVISFLNMRAIMCIRSERFDEGMDYYKYAYQNADGEKDVRAKLKFNMGLAYVRTQDFARAQDCFFESAQLGFQRSQGPLNYVKAKIRQLEKVKADEAAGVAPAAAIEGGEKLDELEWETLY